MSKLKFITIEGIDGSGKSTFIPVIKEYLESLGETVVLTREPGGTPLSEQLRKHILEDNMDITTEALLSFAARKENTEQIIKPALEKNLWVLCDRYTDSTVAYQHYGRGMSLEHIEQLRNMVHGDIEPGLTLIFTVPLHVSKERLGRTGKVPDKFESESDAFFLRTSEGYHEIATNNPDRCKLVDSSKTIENTKEQVLALLENFTQEMKQTKKIKP